MEKVAVQLLLLVISTVRPVQSPVMPWNIQPVPGWGTSVTVAAELKRPMQVPGQSMPGGALVIVPLPTTEMVSVRSTAGGGGGGPGAGGGTAETNVNVAVLAALLPFGLVTMKRCDPAATLFAVAHVRLVALVTETEPHVKPVPADPCVTVEPATKSVPVMVTVVDVLAGPELGLIATTVGAGVGVATSKQ